MPDTDTTQRVYDVFISYAQPDNQPGEEGKSGWATELRDHLLRDQAKFTDHEPSIFFREEVVSSLDEWLQDVQGILRNSRLLLVCLSSHYFASHHCRWEWEEFVRHQKHQRLDPGAVPKIYFVELPDAPEQEIAGWVDQMSKMNSGADLRPWFDEGAQALQELEIDRRLVAQQDASGLGNLKPTTKYFVGRSSEVRQLRDAFANLAGGRMVAIHGLRGLGKTELAAAYANAFASDYPGGRWLLRAGDHGKMMPLINSLGPDLGHLPGEEPEEVFFNRVFTELKERASSQSVENGGDAEAPRNCLLILDNVTDPELLSHDQLSLLPDEPWLHLLVTTRLDSQTHGVNGPSVELGMLSQDQALELIRRHQPQGDFASPEEEKATREIVRELGGFTLAVEAVALFLGLNPEVKPSEYLVRYRQSGMKSLDPTITMDMEPVDDEEVQMRQQLAAVLGPTLERLPETALTALRYAAHFSPDYIPWPWVRELVVSRHIELRDQSEDVVDEIRRRLEKLRLLTATSVEQVSRMHRLVSNHLRAKDECHAPPELLDLVSRRGFALAKLASPPLRWEMGAVTSTFPHLLGRDGVPNQYMRELAAAASSVTSLVITYSGLSQAADLLNAVVPVVENLVRQDPVKSLWQQDLATAREKTGDLYFAKGALDPALKSYEESLEIRKKLSEGNAQDPDLQRDLSISHNKLGDVLRTQGMLDDALEHYRHALLIREALVRLEPRSPERNRDLSVCHERMGDTLRAKGELGKALQSYRDSLAIRAQLVEFDESNTLWQRDLSVSCEKVGNMLRDQHRPDDALSVYRQSLTIRQRLAAREPDNVVWLHDLSVCHNKIGDVYRSQGKLDKAMAAYRESLALSERLVATSRANVLWQRDLSVSRNKMGDILLSQGSAEEALQSYTASLELREQHAEAERNNPSWQRDLSVCHSKVGDALRQLGQMGQARQAYLESLAIVERLVQINPNNAAWQRDHWVLCWRIAVISEKVGDAETMQWWQRAYRTLQGMQERGLYISVEDQGVMGQLAERVGVTA